MSTNPKTCELVVGSGSRWSEFFANWVAELNFFVLRFRGKTNISIYK